MNSANLIPAEHVQGKACFYPSKIVQPIRIRYKVPFSVEKIMILCQSTPYKCNYHMYKKLF